MLYDPADHYEPKETKEYFEKKSKVYERLMKIKQSGFIKAFRKKDKQKEDEQKKQRSFVSLFSMFFSWSLKRERKLLLNIFFVIKFKIKNVSD